MGSDHTHDLLIRKSISGLLSFVCSSLVTWSSHHQRYISSIIILLNLQPFSLQQSRLKFFTVFYPILDVMLHNSTLSDKNTYLRDKVCSFISTIKFLRKIDVGQQSNTSIQLHRYYILSPPDDIPCLSIIPSPELKSPLIFS